LKNRGHLQYWSYGEERARMLTIYRLEDGRLNPVPADQPPLPDDAIWVDLIDPTPEDRLLVERAYGVHLPSGEDLIEIEASSRFFRDDDGLHIHSLFLHEFEDTTVNVSAAFILNHRRLFTLHEQELATFRLFRQAADHQPDIATDATSILFGLFENKVDHLADILETVYTGLEPVSLAVLGRKDTEMQKLLGDIARFEDITGKVRLSLLDAQRALTFTQRNSQLGSEPLERAQELLRDIDSLMPHTAFLSDKVNFLMGAVHGFTNIEQNQIIKIFSIAAVVFLPPTLIASIYGMNFHFIPELGWRYGYPLALILMVASGIAPLWYFKKKGWL
jgi:magnesium transporter